jgi:fimbrial chaperone protein
MFRGVRFPQSIRRGVAFVVALAAGMSILSAAWAMRVAPMVSELTTTGAGSTARIEVGNIGSAALPFETRITRVEFDENGELVETAADDEFLVFPPQGLVPVGGRQVVRVQWVGEPDIEVSHAYYLWVRQLPVATEPVATEAAGAVSVSVLYTMKALLVVAPPNAQPDVRVVSVTPSMVTPPAPEVDPSLTGGEALPAAPAQPGVEIVVTNSGRRYALMSGATWIIEGTRMNGEPFILTLAGQEVAQTVGVGYLAPAGGRRTFKVPTGEALDPAKPVTVRFAR